MARPIARCCLFGAVDHKEIRKAHMKEMAKIDSENRAKWDFNFDKEEPSTNGNHYIWERFSTATRSCSSLHNSK
jgi:hypothetical protein